MTRERPDALDVDRPALASLELATIARGVVVLDQMLKRAEATVTAARTVSPGRYLLLLCGEVAEVEEVLEAGVAAAGDDLVDHVILHDPHPELRAGLAGRARRELDGALAVAEIATVSSGLGAIDRALKFAEVGLIELRLGSGISGKAVFTLTGSLDMIESARDAVADAVEAPRLIRFDIIARPHPDLPSRLLDAEACGVRGAP